MPKCQNCGVDINYHEVKCRLVDVIAHTNERTAVTAYLCHTQTSAFDLCELIKSNGGKAHKYVDECRVLSDYTFTNEEVAGKANAHFYWAEEPAEIEIKMFGELKQHNN